MFLYPYWILSLDATLPEPLKFCIMFAFYLNYKVPIMSVSFQTHMCSLVFTTGRTISLR